jgi:hypothetical protein
MHTYIHHNVNNLKHEEVCTISIKQPERGHTGNGKVATDVVTVTSTSH